jgi:hypothetical protein
MPKREEMKEGQEKEGRGKGQMEGKVTDKVRDESEREKDTPDCA